MDFDFDFIGIKRRLKGFPLHKHEQEGFDCTIMRSIKIKSGNVFNIWSSFLSILPTNHFFHLLLDINFIFLFVIFVLIFIFIVYMRF